MFEDLTSETLAIGLAWYVVFVVSTSLHEAAHAFTAWKLGDPTAYEGGQVTLNPLPHIEREPFGMVVVPILSFLLSGWVVGWASAPYDPYWAARHPKRAALMALAGPAANLLLVVLAGIVLRIGLQFDLFAWGMDAEEGIAGIADAFVRLVLIVFTLNLILMTFNLLPIPPLDGAAALPLVIPPASARQYVEFMRQPGFSIIGLIVAWRLFGFVFDPVSAAAEKLVKLGL